MMGGASASGPSLGIRLRLNLYSQPLSQLRGPLWWVSELEGVGGAGDAGEPALCCSWLAAPSPREILTPWKTEQAGRQAGEEELEGEEEKGERPRAQGEVGVGAPLINQSHQLSGLTKTRDPVGAGAGAGGGEGGTDHLMGCWEERLK